MFLEAHLRIHLWRMSEYYLQNPFQANIMDNIRVITTRQEFSMDIISLKAYAKINLALDVIGKRPNGYHDVRMIMQTIKLYDKITIKPTTNPDITLKTNLHFLPTNENNIVYAACKLFKETFQISDGFYINLEKRIPVAAGMAGGSSDAAATLFGLNELFQTNQTLEDLYENLALDENTKHPNIDGMIEAIEKQDLHQMSSLVSNVLESVTIKHHPEIERIKMDLLSHGALNALMSGSGPTVFALFDNQKTAERAFYEYKVGPYGKQTFLTRFFESKSVSP